MGSRRRAFRISISSVPWSSSAFSFVIVSPSEVLKERKVLFL